MTEAVNSMVPSLTSTLIDRNLEFMKVYMGTQKLAPRWRDCVTEVNRKYGIATSSMYVRSYFDNESKAIVEGIVKDLKQTFLEILQTVDWMDDITRVRAHEKAEAMESHIAYPNELLDDSKIEEYYTGVHNVVQLMVHFYGHFIFSWKLLENILKWCWMPINFLWMSVMIIYVK